MICATWCACEDRNAMTDSNNGNSNGNGNGNGNHRPGGNGGWGMNPRRAKGGIKARSTRGQFAKNWWAQRWIEAMERLVPGPRLTRGRHYARLGQVVRMDETKGGVIALVQGSRPKPYKVTIQVTPFNRQQWHKVLDVLAGQAIFAAQLLAGEMPADIQDAFKAAGTSLFPDRASDLITSCSCPDKANPCKHIAAAHYILGDRFDEDPWLIFRLRGQNQEWILNELRKRRGMTAEGGSLPVRRRGQPVQAAERPAPESGKPFSQAEFDRYWQMGTSLEDFAFQIRPPAIPQPLMQRLGEPEFPGQLSLHRQLEDAYDMMSQAAIMIAFGDVPAPPEEEEE
jgi:uncharacterized Zn finger protein